MTPTLQKLITDLADSTEGSDAVAALTGFANAHGFDCFTYISAGPGQYTPSGVSTYPREWLDYYLRRRYHEIDPVIASARGFLPFVWDGRRPRRRLSGEQRRLFGEAGDFGINSGLSVPIHDGQGGSGLLSFASDQPLSALRGQMLENRRAFHLAAIEFHVHATGARHPLVEATENPLSPREADCLNWVAEGKLIREIAEILGVTPRTVAFHLENAKRKLNAVTLAQAAVMAYRRASGNALTYGRARVATRVRPRVGFVQI